MRDAITKVVWNIIGPPLVTDPTLDHISLEDWEEAHDMLWEVIRALGAEIEEQEKVDKLFKLAYPEQMEDLIKRKQND